MSVFGLYSEYYDLLYSDKDYGREAAYVADLIREHAPRAKAILELGCGTGAHAAHFAGTGFDVYGIDASESMLERARIRKEALAPDVADRLSFGLGDIRTFRAGRTYDVVISLFHVFGYQVSNSDLQKAFQTAANHLSPGGLLIFDYWYGPAVLTQRPETRIKRLEDDTLQVVRLAEPRMNSFNNSVTVDYWVLLDSKKDARSERVLERHIMRYLFIPEIEIIADPWFAAKSHYAWESRRNPDVSDWSAVTVMERRG